MKIRPLYISLSLVLSLFFTTLVSSQIHSVEKSHQCAVTAAVSSFAPDLTDLDNGDLGRATTYSLVLKETGRSPSFLSVNTTFNFTSYCQSLIRAPPGLS